MATPVTPAPTSTVPTLYQRVLGRAFETLPPALCRFHGSALGGTGRGLLRVRRGQGVLQCLAADLLRLPPAGDAVPIRLQVEVRGDRERWIRRFATVRLVSEQSCRDGLLVEAVGPVRFTFRLIATPHALRYCFVRGWLFGLPFPSWCALRVDAETSTRGEAWHLDVRLYAPLLGLLLRYEGDIEGDIAHQGPIE